MQNTIRSFGFQVLKPVNLVAVAVQYTVLEGMSRMCYLHETLYCMYVNNLLL
jgi:hypothetical protein